MTATDLASWFDKRTIGALPPQLAADKLRELGEGNIADEIEATVARRRIGFPKFKRKRQLYEHTSHAFGFIRAGAGGSGGTKVVNACSVAADKSLKHARLKVTLDQLRVAKYPGGGMHTVLFDFYAQNQVQGQVEHLHFSQLYRVQEGEQAGVVGYPVFIGLNVGTQGVSFKCYTVNVKNDQDERLLNFLDSDVFKAGVTLGIAINPIVGVVSTFAKGLVQMVASRNKNAAVQDFYMGLDFTNATTRARLKEGSYIAVQVPERPNAFDWDEWVYSPKRRQIVAARDDSPIPYNYIIFSVSRYIS